MPTPPPAVARFLEGRRFAVVGVSRTAGVGNSILRKLRASGYEAIPVNPHAGELEGVRCYPSLEAIPGTIDGVVFAGPPRAALACARQCDVQGIPRIWFHRAFGDGSVADAAVEECRRLGVEAIVGGCPMMWCEPVDVAHRCMRWWLGRKGRLPAA